MSDHATLLAQARAAVAAERSSPVVAIAEASRNRLLTADEEQVLGRLLRDPAHAEAATALLYDRNTRLIWQQVNRYRRAEGGPLDRDDLYAYGVEGFLHALTKWEPERGLKLSTYAIMWIQQRIRRALDDHRPGVRLPVHLAERLRVINRETARFVQQHGRKPTDAEVAALVGLSIPQLATSRAAAALYVESLDAPIDADGDPERTLHGIIGGDSAEDALENAISSEARTTVARLLSHLTTQQRRIIELRYGLDGHGEMRTLEAVGAMIGLTRERVRQIERDALTTIRGLACPVATGWAAD